MIDALLVNPDRRRRLSRRPGWYGVLGIANAISWLESPSNCLRSSVIVRSLTSSSLRSRSKLLRLMDSHLSPLEETILILSSLPMRLLREKENDVKSRLLRSVRPSGILGLQITLPINLSVMSVGNPLAANNSNNRSVRPAN